MVAISWLVFLLSYLIYFFYSSIHQRPAWDLKWDFEKTWNEIFCFFKILYNVICCFGGLWCYQFRNGDVVATALISFLDKYLLFLSWEDWKFVSTITFLFSLWFWTLCGERCVHYWCFLFLSFIFKPYNFWRLNVYFCFSFDKDLPILAFSLSQAILLILCGFVLMIFCHFFRIFKLYV